MVIGIGQSYRGDDGCGPFVIEELKNLNLEGLSRLKLFQSTGDVTELLEQFENFERVIIIDAMASSPDQPRRVGEIVTIQGSKDSLPKLIDTLPRSSTHSFNLIQSIELARSLKVFPKALHIFGIVGQSFELNHELSPEVKATSLKLVAKIRKLVEGESHARNVSDSKLSSPNGRNRKK